MKVIGIVGTAKNTGKTTTLGAMIAESAAHQERLAVTSIGYDGEEIDTITGLPKPRLFLRAGTLVVTSERCLAHTSAAYRIIRMTDVETALGRIVIVEITRDGLIVLAGPNTKKLLRDIIDEVGLYGVDRMFVDGSLNRIAAMAAVETMIITTGASRSRETGFLSDESRAICRLFDLPQMRFTSHDPNAERIRVLDRGGAAAISELPFGSLYDEDDALRVIQKMTGHASAILIPHLVSNRALKALAAGIPRGRLHTLTIVVADPTVMLLAGEPIETVRVIDDARRGGVDNQPAFTIAYSQRMNVAALTVNPFYARQSGHVFIPESIDKTALLSDVAQAVPVPVFNMRDAGAQQSLFSLL